ncbi:uncharacterized protein EDB93DRAFT_885842 [Suillus bovinus]|uniref:uncharacterized protein n=1 Tax=Suillus bovinus TaxID=48563 RepID=UPI001B86AAFE|nr:uncharacterized protein EDB93DRAFT_885842 [Suillus bovinus]KAG2133235.1 hypothetical protein EDB93DRAFT_885842 [Suillus bovinus]
MFFPPPMTDNLPPLPLENMEALAVDRLSWFAGYDIENHEWITFKGLNCDESVYDKHAWSKLVKDQQTMDLIQSILDTIGCSPGNPQRENALEGMNVLLKGALGTGKKTVAHAICNMLKRPMLDIRAGDIPMTCDPANVQPWAAKVASLAMKWNAVIVVDRGDYFMNRECADGPERINLMTQEFKFYGCICLWPAVLTDEQQALLMPFSATIKFPDLDLAARRQRWLQLFGRDDLAAAISSGKDATEQDTKAWTFLREIEKISWYKLDGVDIDSFMALAQNLAGGQGATPQDVKKYLKVWGVPLSARSKVARFFALLTSDVRPTDFACEGGMVPM